MGREYAHHCIRISIEIDRGVENLGVSAEPLPHLVSQDHDVVFARHAFFRKEIAAEVEPVSHHAIEASGNAAGEDIFRLSLSSDIEAAFCPCIHVLEDSALLFPVKKVSGRNPVTVAL